LFDEYNQIINFLVNDFFYIIGSCKKCNVEKNMLIFDKSFVF